MENSTHPMSNTEMTAGTGKEDAYSNARVHEFMEELKSLLNAAAATKTIKEELIMSLQILLRNYWMLKDLPLTSEIDQHINKECKDICSITLSDAEMKMLWNG